MLRLSIPLSIRHAKLPLLLGAWLALGPAVPAAGGEIYAWQDEDGSYAFTDDRKSIPPRYRDQVEVRESQQLADYPRFTPQDASAAQRYETRLAARLERLRALNAARARAAGGSPGKAASARSGESITLRTGLRDRAGVDITVPGGASDQPIVTETRWLRPEGKAIAQPVYITRQGDRILAITKSRPREWNVMSDLIDEEELLEELSEE